MKKDVCLLHMGQTTSAFPEATQTSSMSCIVFSPLVPNRLFKASVHISRPMRPKQNTKPDQAVLNRYIEA